MTFEFLKKDKKDNSRKHPARDDARKKAKVAGAQERQAAYDAMTPRQKLDYLDAQFGKGLGAAKVRAKLAAILKEAKAKPSATEAIPAMAEAKRKTKAKERREAEREGLKVWRG